MYNHYPYPDELYHFGIPGMKWGRRKQRPVGNNRVQRSIDINNERTKVTDSRGLSNKQKAAIGAVSITAGKIAFDKFGRQRVKKRKLLKFIFGGGQARVAKAMMRHYIKGGKRA